MGNNLPNLPKLSKIEIKSALQSLSNVPGYIINLRKQSNEQLHELTSIKSKFQKKYKYGWNREKYERDNKDTTYYVLEAGPYLNYIKKVDLRYFCPPVIGQGFLKNSPTHAVVSAYYFDILKPEQSSNYKYFDTKTDLTIPPDPLALPIARPVVETAPIPQHAIPIVEGATAFIHANNTLSAIVVPTIKPLSVLFVSYNMRDM